MKYQCSGDTDKDTFVQKTELHNFFYVKTLCGKKKKKKKKNQDTGNISKNLNTIRLPRRNLLGGISSPNRQNKETNETNKETCF